MAAVLTEQFHHILVAPARRYIQGCRAVVGLGIDIGLVGQQQLHDILR